MSKTWILLVIIVSFKGAELTRVEFSSKEACVSGGNTFLKHAQETINYYDQSVKTVCVPKGDEK